MITSDEKIRYINSLLYLIAHSDDLDFIKKSAKKVEDMPNVDYLIFPNNIIFADDGVGEKWHKTVKFAKSSGKLEQLQDMVLRLSNLYDYETRMVTLMMDAAPHSFTWRGSMFGGLIYHSHDGLWGIHT